MKMLRRLVLTLWIVALTAEVIAGPAARRLATDESPEVSPWLANGWAAEECQGSKEPQEICRQDAEFGLRLKYQKLSQEGQRWINQTCPDTYGVHMDGCVHEQVKEMLRAGWPILDRVSPAMKLLVESRCSRYLGPSKWRACVEDQLAGDLSPPVQPKTAKDKWPAALDASGPMPRWSAAPVPLPAKPVARTLDATEIFRRVSPAVLVIIASPNIEAMRAHQGNIGSGVAISPTLALTACHVVEGNAIVTVYNAHIGKPLFATILSGDTSTDRCILNVRGTMTPIASLRPSRELDVGERVYTIGAPRGLFDSLSEGLVSGVRTDGGIAHIQTTAPISPGSSGGALVDAHGALVGITKFTLKDSQNINFAIAAEEFWR